MRRMKPQNTSSAAVPCQAILGSAWHCHDTWTGPRGSAQNKVPSKHPTAGIQYTCGACLLAAVEEAERRSIQRVWQNNGALECPGRKGWWLIIAFPNSNGSNPMSLESKRNWPIM
jgi:hypothetical protein